MQKRTQNTNQNIGFRVTQTGGCKVSIFSLLDLWPWTSELMFLNVNFFIFEIEIMLKPHRYKLCELVCEQLLVEYLEYDKISGNNDNCIYGLRIMQQ